MRNLKLFVQWYVKRSWSNHIALEVDGLKDRKIYRLKARPCICQPGNFTDWGSEGVKTSSPYRSSSEKTTEPKEGRSAAVTVQFQPQASELHALTVEGHGNDQSAFKCVVVPTGKIPRSHVLGALVKLACFVFRSDLSDWLPLYFS